MSTAEQLTPRERRLWRIWLALVAFLVVGSFLLTGLAMYFGPAPVVRHTKRSRARWTEAATPTPDAGAASFRSSPLADDARATPFTGPGLVWVNTHSHIYHFPGYRWYGRTIHGKYASEEEALAEGDRAALNERRPAGFSTRPLQ